MKRAGLLPTPRLTATITPPVRRGELGVVTFPSARRIKPGRSRTNRAHHCSACKRAGLSGVGHNSGNRRCPTRAAA